MVGYVRKEDKVMRYTVVLERDARVIVPDHRLCAWERFDASSRTPI